MGRISSDLKGFFLLTGIFLFVGTLDILSVYFYYHHVQSFINEQPDIRHADAGIIFFGDYINHGAELGPDSKLRAGKAVGLYQSGKIRKVICVGGYRYADWKGKPHLMRKYLIENQVPAFDIIYDSSSYNTITNIQELKKITTRLKYDTIIAISSPLHIFRIATMIKSSTVYFATYKYSLQGFHDYWVLFKDVHHEYVSQILNSILKDELRNKLVLIYSFISDKIDQIF
jgi:uncharacterized SAM-binding protein YcdF (DUF218 family)